MSKNFSLKIQHFVTKELNQQQVRKHASILLKPVLTNISNIGGSEKDLDEFMIEEYTYDIYLLLPDRIEFSCLTRVDLKVLTFLQIIVLHLGTQVPFD